MQTCEMSIDEQSIRPPEEGLDAEGHSLELADDGTACLDCEDVEDIADETVYVYPPFIETGHNPVTLNPPRRRWTDSGWFALGISLALHGAIVVIGIFFFVRFVPPHWQFERGDGTSTSDYAASSDQ